MSPIPKTVNEQPCHHCGTLHSQGTKFSIQCNGEKKSMCCPGCAAVAEMMLALQSPAQAKD